MLPSSKPPTGTQPVATGSPAENETISQHQTTVRRSPDHSEHCRCSLCLDRNRLLDILSGMTIVSPIPFGWNIQQLPMPTLPNLKELLVNVHTQDQKLIVEKDKSYEGSWKNDGGIGAYFTFKRPIDRFIAIAKRNGYDLFKVWQEEDEKGILFQDGTLSACILDIRCYMALIQTEMMARKAVDNYNASMLSDSPTTQQPRQPITMGAELREFGGQTRP